MNLFNAKRMLLGWLGPSGSRARRTEPTFSGAGATFPYPIYSNGRRPTGRRPASD